MFFPFFFFPFLRGKGKKSTKKKTTKKAHIITRDKYNTQINNNLIIILNRKQIIQVFPEPYSLILNINKPKNIFIIFCRLDEVFLVSIFSYIYIIIWLLLCIQDLLIV